MDTDSASLVLEMIQALERRDDGRLLAIYSPDVEFIWPPQRGQTMDQVARPSSAPCDANEIAASAAFRACLVAALSGHHQREFSARLATLIAVAVGSKAAASGAARASLGRLVRRVTP